MAARIETKQELPPAEVKGNRAGPPYLLLADDDRDEAASLARLLLNSSISCDVVGSRDDALRAFRSRDYDMILMNVRGPLIDGLDAAKAIRNVERSFPEPRVPIFILTESASEQERLFAKSADVDDVLERSTDVTDLAAMVEHEFEISRRTPDSYIQREPLQFAKLLRDAAGDNGGAVRLAEEFARVLAQAIAEARAAIETGKPEQMQSVSQRLRESAVKSGSGRVQLIAVLLSRMNTAGELRSRGAELLKECEEAARDLGVWLELKLGQVIIHAQAPAAASGKRTTVKMFSFLKNRVDVFSKVS